MRTEFVGDIEEQNVESELAKALPENSNIRLIKQKKKNIILFVTKESHCLGDILIRYHGGDLDANILAVISNHSQLQNLVEKFNIPYFFF